MVRSVSKPLRTSWRPRWHLWRPLGLSIAVIGAYRAIGDWRDDHAFLVNMTASLPNWAFLIHKNKVPQRGDYVFFMAPANALVRRHFGTKPQPFGKRVYGLPGDIVSHEGAWVTVNGKTVARMKPRTRFGEPLTPVAAGRIPDGCFYVGTPHPDGLDSRYAEIGLICTHRLIGTGVPIL